MQCVFCADVTAAGDLLFEDPLCWIVLHPDHAVAGHVMIVAKRHVENVSELPEEEWIHIARIWRRAEAVVLETTGAGRAIVLKLGIQTPHLHLHLYPVDEQTGRDAVFAAFDARTSVPRSEERIALLRKRLRAIG